MSTNEHPPHLHVPVLVDEIITRMQPKPGETYLDLTAGYGGHAERFFEATSQYENSALVDRDEFAITRLESFKNKQVQILHCDFLTAALQLTENHQKFNLIMADLGVSSPQLDRLERGFSFQGSAPLDMRMDRRQELTAQMVVNSYTQNELTRIIKEYGEEPTGDAVAIARAIVDARPIETTKQLAELITTTIRGPWNKTKKIHPATRTFQAIRIEVNDELGQIKKLLPLLPRLLSSGGRVGIISFHSLEDRLVKNYFKDQANSGYEAELDIMTPKPLSGGDYDVHNPRSRSAKLRIAVKK